MNDYTDPLQFACRRNGSTDAAVLYISEKCILTFRENRKFCKADVLWFFQCLQFNTIQPPLLVQKHLNMKIPSSVTLRISDYLTNRLIPYVWLNRVLSSAICTHTGAPQSKVLVPFLFLMYTADCRSTDEPCPLVKFAEDIELVGKMSNNEDALQQAVWKLSELVW